MCIPSNVIFNGLPRDVLTHNWLECSIRVRKLGINCALIVSALLTWQHLSQLHTFVLILALVALTKFWINYHCTLTHSAYMYIISGCFGAKIKDLYKYNHSSTFSWHLNGMPIIARLSRLQMHLKLHLL